VRCVICACGVVGVCVPPVVVWLHLVHFQIPVWVRFSVVCPHCLHLYFCLVFASIVAVIFLSFLPYLGPYLPLVPVFFPFFLCCAMFIPRGIFRVVFVIVLLRVWLCV